MLWVIVATLACTVLGRRLDSVILTLSRPSCWVWGWARGAVVECFWHWLWVWCIIDSALALGSPEFLTDSLDKEKNTPSVVCLLAISQLASFSCAHGVSISLSASGAHIIRKGKGSRLWSYYTFEGQKNNIGVTGSRFCWSQLNSALAQRASGSSLVKLIAPLNKGGTSPWSPPASYAYVASRHCI